MKPATILLINPPVVRPCEPPAGIARLVGALEGHGIRCRVLDANIEGLMALLQGPVSADDTWSKRALRHRAANLSVLRSENRYRKIDRYRQAVRELNRLLDVAGRPFHAQIGLANYQDTTRSPLRSADLIGAAERPEENPFFPYLSRRLVEICDNDEPAIIGLSLTYLSQAITTFSLIGFIRGFLPGAKIVLGGGLVTSWISRPGWENPFGGLVDELVAGPGEEPLLEMCGIAPSRRHAVPDYAPFRDLPYLSPGFVLPYSASSGCWWGRCTFCPEKAEGNRYTHPSIHDTLSDIERLIGSEKPSLVHFLDNAMSPALLAAIGDNPLGIPWYGFARITRHLTDPAFCRQLKRSGCVLLKLGLESGNQGVIEALDKGIDLAEASQALKALKEAGIGTYVYLLFGTPAEGPEEARDTLDYVRRHHAYINFLNLAVFNLPAYGPDTAGLETENFYDGDLTLYRQFRHPGGWYRGRVRRFLEDDFKRDPSIRSIVLRDPPVFTSNHAPFFLTGEKDEGNRKRENDGNRSLDRRRRA